MCVKKWLLPKQLDAVLLTFSLGGSNVPMQVFARPILKVQPAFFIVFLLGDPGTLDSRDEAVVSSRNSRSKLFPPLSQEPSQAKIHKSTAAILSDDF